MNETFLEKIQNPSRFLGDEVNAVAKDPGSVTAQAVLLFPDHYDLGMSHLGYKIIYHLLNEEADILAERGFNPEPDLEKRLRAEGLKLTSLETGRELTEFDVVGLTLPHELAATNVLALLDLGGLPLVAAERSDSDPIVLAGGPAAFNPEPLADFLDAVFLGDGEAGAVEAVRLVGRAKRKGLSRAEILRKLEEIEGIYIPGLYQPEYPNGRFAGMQRIDGQPVQPLTKATLGDINETFFPQNQIVPFGKPVHDRLTLELARGCTRGCRFCQAGMLYRPVREKTPNTLYRQALAALKKTGYDEISLLSLSSGDYSCLVPLLEGLMARLAEERVAVSLPSLRADSFSRETAELIRKVRATGFTLAPEAGSERLRAVINKNLTESEILTAARKAASSGWRLLKLYFMVGLPTETEADLEELVGLVKKIARETRGVKLNVSLGGFVPKSHTPFQWDAQLPADEIKARMDYIRSGLRKLRSVRVKWNSPVVAQLDGLLSRGDRRLTPVILRAYRAGARFEAWSEHFRWPVWEAALAQEGLAPETFQAPLDPDAPLPWDHLAPVEKTFLLRERELALAGEQSPDCREDSCQGCGVCDFEEIQPRTYPGQGITITPPHPKRARPTRLAFSYHKLGPARFLGHLEMVQIFHRALRRAGVGVGYSQGFHPQPKVSFFGAMPVGAESLDEWAEVEVLDNRPPAELMKLLNERLTEGLKVTTMALRTTKIKVLGATYRISPKNPEWQPEPTRVEDFLAAREVPFERQRTKKLQKFDLRKPVERLEIVMGGEIEVTILAPESGPTPKVEEVITHVFDLKPEEFRVLKLKSVF